MPDVPDAGIPPQEVERRLDELRDLYRFWLALQEMRFVDASEVRESPAPDPGDSRELHERERPDRDR